MSSRGMAVWETGVERQKFGKVVSVLEKQKKLEIIYIFFSLSWGSCFSSCGRY